MTEQHERDRARELTQHQCGAINLQKQSQKSLKPSTKLHWQHDKIWRAQPALTIVLNDFITAVCPCCCSMTSLILAPRIAVCHLIHPCWQPPAQSHRVPQTLCCWGPQPAFGRSFQTGDHTTHLLALQRPQSSVGMKHNTRGHKMHAEH